MSDTDRLVERVSRLEGQVDSILRMGVPSATSSTDSKELIEKFELFAKVAAALLAAVAGATGLLYAFGFVIVNIYLLSFGVRLFELTKPTYLVSGVVFCFFHLVLFAIPVGVSGYVTYLDERVGRRMFVINVLGGIAPAGAAYFLMLLALTSNSAPGAFNGGGGMDLPLDPELLLMHLFLVTVLAVGVVEYIRVRYLKESPYVILRAFVLGTLIMVPVLAPVLVISWSDSIYPEIDPAFGGGRPVPVQLVVGPPDGLEAAESALRQLGIEVDEGVTEPVGLLDESEKALVVVVENGDAVKLDRAYVQHVRYLHEGSPP